MKIFFITLIILFHTTHAICQKKSNTSQLLKNVQIEVIYLDKSVTDSLFLHYKDHYWGNIPGIAAQWANSNGKKNSFNFEIKNNDKASYFSIGKWNKYGGGITLVNFFLAEPGDNVKIYVSKDSLSFTGNRLKFTGKGAAKYQCQYEISELQYKAEYRGPGPNYTLSSDGEILHDSLFYFQMVAMFKNTLKRSNLIKFASLEILASYKDGLSPLIYNIIKTDVVCREENANYNRLTYPFKIFSRYPSTALKGRITDEVRQIYAKRPVSNLFKIPQQYRVLSDQYIQYMVSSTADTILSKNSKYPWLKSNFSGVLRDRIATAYLQRYYAFKPGLDKEVKDALSYVKTPYCRDILLSFSTLIPSTPAFNFALPDSSDKIVMLSDLRGKVVIMDFWFTGCVGCAELNKKMRPISEYFTGNDKVVFVTVNIDKDRDEWKSSLISEKYTHKGSIDLFTDGSNFKSPIIKHYNIVGYPTLILIDPSGNIITGNPPRPPKEKEFITLVEKHLLN